jgi:prepilin-type N-terminal cleavage/methylation domain-containing protein
MMLHCLKIPNHGNPDACRGFTLIEVLIALAIFSIGILAVAGLQIRSINMNTAARMQSEATTVAVDVMERLMGLPYEHPQLDESIGVQQSQVGVYTAFWQITDETPVSWCKTIAVWVTADNPNAREVRINFIRGPEW